MDRRIDGLEAAGKHKMKKKITIEKKKTQLEDSVMVKRNDCVY